MNKVSTDVFRQKTKVESIFHQRFDNASHVRQITSPEIMRHQRNSKVLLKPKSLALLIEDAQHAQEVRVEASSKDKSNEKMKKLFKDSDELSIIAKQLMDDILHSPSCDVQFSNVLGLEEAKRVLRESVIFPIQYPKLFKGLLQPWRAVLLYGVPGTGKTYLAKALSHESNSTFFNIPASSIVSKYRGESEKIVRVLFTLARTYAPSIIFFDEADALMGIRASYGGGGEHQEHEGSRRLKTELLVEMDGINTSNDHVFVLAATNLPWEIDTAFLRRLEKRILIPLPDKRTRISLIREYLKDHNHLIKDHELSVITDLLDGFSACDIKQVCKETVMEKVRKVLYHEPININSKSPVNEFEALDLDNLLTSDPITPVEMECSIKTIKRTTSPDLAQRYNTWELNYGSK